MMKAVTSTPRGLFRVTVEGPLIADTPAGNLSELLALITLHQTAATKLLQETSKVLADLLAEKS